MFLVRHNGNNAPIAIGGCRLRAYTSKGAALDDAKRLALNMTLKYRVAGLEFDGLKAVIYSFQESHRSTSFQRIGEWLQSCHGTCYLATDMGTTIDDMNEMAKRTDYVIEQQGAIADGGFIDLLATGVLSGLEAAAAQPWRAGTFSESTAFVLGLGNAGLRIARDLKQYDCKVSAWDTCSTPCVEAKEADIALDSQGITGRYDLLLPCAGPSMINKNNAHQIKARIIGGAANNPSTDEAEQALHKKGTIIIPDFIISAGAILLDDRLIANERPTVAEGLQRTKRIYDAVQETLEKSRKQHILPRVAALQIMGME